MGSALFPFRGEGGGPQHLSSTEQELLCARLSVLGDLTRDCLHRAELSHSPGALGGQGVPGVTPALRSGVDEDHFVAFLTRDVL